MIGGCRNDGDRERVAALEETVRRLGLEENVDICVNLPYPQLLEYLRRARAGIHTMRDEHFGIGVVEFMASGVVTLAHNSAGPRMDIVVPDEAQPEQPVGFLAASATEYAEQLAAILQMGEAEVRRIQTAARAVAQQRFSEARFQQGFGQCVGQLLEMASEAGGDEEGN